MNGYLLNKFLFAQLDENIEMQSNCTSFHLALFNWYCEKQNLAGFDREVFDVPTDESMRYACFGKRSTYYEKFDDLVNWGLIILVKKSTNTYQATKISLRTPKFAEFAKNFGCTIACTQKGTTSGTGGGTSDSTSKNIEDSTYTQIDTTSDTSGGTTSDTSGGQVQLQEGSTIKTSKQENFKTEQTLNSETKEDLEAKTASFFESDESLVDGKVIPLMPNHPNEKKKTARAKKEPAPPKEPSTHAKFLDAYISFYSQRNSMEPYIGLGDRKAVNDISAYLKTQNKDKDADENVNDENALNILNFIFSKWGTLSDFYQQQITLCQIKKNLPNIIECIKNGKQKGNGFNRNTEYKDTLSAHNQSLNDRIAHAGTF